jgi:hypothetical protein
VFRKDVSILALEALLRSRYSASVSGNRNR